MDNVDKATKDADIFIQASLSRIDKDKKGAPFTGRCLFCGKKLRSLKRRWCNAECRDGWEKENGNGNLH